MIDAAYKLENLDIDHRNFLEIILLLSKADLCLKEHLEECINKSKRLHESGAQQGRGSLVTLMSATTVSSVVDTLQHLIQETISSEAEKAGMFSVKIDTMQDITSQERCSVVLRYVTYTVQERLLTLTKCKDYSLWTILC